MTTTTQTMTADELIAVPEDGMQRELIDGVLLTMSPDNSDHSSVASNLHVALALFVRGNDLGRIWGNAGFIIRRNPDTVLAPDIAFVPADRAPRVGAQRGYFPGYPDLAVEILSPSNTADEMDRKRRLYFAAGVRLVWIVDPDQRNIAVHLPNGRIWTLQEGVVLDGGDVLPGFTIPVADIFA